MAKFPPLPELIGAPAPSSSPRPHMRAFPRSIRSLLFLAALVLAAACGKDAVPQDALDATVVQVGDAKLTGKVLQQWLLKSPTPPRWPRRPRSWSAPGSTRRCSSRRRSRGCRSNDSALTDAAIGPDAARGMILEFWAGRANARPAPHRCPGRFAGQGGTTSACCSTSSCAIPRGADSMTVVGIANRARGDPRAGAGRRGLHQAGQGGLAGFGHAGHQRLPPGGRAGGAAAPDPRCGVGPGGGRRLEDHPVARRPSHRASSDVAAESRRGSSGGSRPRYSRRADSIYVDSLARAAQMVIAEDARERVRAMLHEPLPVGDGGPLVTWTGGALDAGSGARLGRDDSLARNEPPSRSPRIRPSPPSCVR